MQIMESEKNRGRLKGMIASQMSSTYRRATLSWNSYGKGGTLRAALLPFFNGFFSAFCHGNTPFVPDGFYYPECYPF
ncbi:MAG: hypothetical protein ACFFDT_37190, partial [Candidatus Hodarchaeota archaeon]